MGDHDAVKLPRHQRPDELNAPLLLMDDDPEDSNIKTLLMMQTMSQGNNGLDMNTMLPFLLMGNEDSDSDNVLLMVMMNSMTGGMDSPQGFEHNFNLMMPLLLLSGNDDNDASDDDSETDMDMLVLMMAMQSQAPGSAMGSNAMLPLLMMNEGSDNNQELIMFMFMMNNQHC